MSYRIYKILVIRKLAENATLIMSPFLALQPMIIILTSSDHVGIKYNISNVSNIFGRHGDLRNG